MALGKKTGGRTKGTPNKATADVKAAAQVYTSEAVESLAKIMRDSDSDAAKVAAIREILDRGHGKARQALDVDANVTAVISKIQREIVRPPNTHG
jgi:hypothetical protein